MDRNSGWLWFETSQHLRYGQKKNDENSGGRGERKWSAVGGVGDRLAEYPGNAHAESAHRLMAVERHG